MSIKVKIDALINRFKRVRRITLSIWLCLFLILTVYQFGIGEGYAPQIEDSVIIEVGGKSLSYERSNLDWHKELDISALDNVDQNEIKKLKVILSERPDKKLVYEGNTSLESQLVSNLLKIGTVYKPYLYLLGIITITGGIYSSIANQSIAPVFTSLLLTMSIIYGHEVALAVIGVEKVDVQEQRLVEVPTEHSDFVLTQVAHQLNLYGVAKRFAERIDYHSVETSEAKSQILALKESVGVNLTENEMASYTAMVNDARAKKERITNSFKVVMLALSVLLSLMTLWLYFLNNNYQIIGRYAYHREFAHYYRSKAAHAKGLLDL